MAEHFNRRSFLIKSAQVTGAVLGASALLEACGPATKGKSSLTIMGNDSEITKAYLAEFESLNPDIEVTYLTYDPIRLNALYAQGNPPDFVRANGVPEMPNVMARGLALNLDPYFAKSTVLKVDDLQPINDVFRWDGKQVGQGPRYGMVQDWGPDMQFWYNKQLFDAANLPAPSATEPLAFPQFLDIGKKLTTRQNGKIQAYGLDNAWNIHYFNQGQVLQQLAQLGTTAYSDDFSKANFTSPQARQVFQWYVDWAQAHVGPSVLDPDASNMFALFPANREGQVALGYFFGRTIAADTSGLQNHVGLAPAPQWGSNRISACFSGTGAYIPARSKNPDAAWRFFEYFFAGTPAKNRAQVGSGVPSLKSLLPSLVQAQPYQQEAYTSVTNELQYLQPLRFNPYVNSDAMEAALAKYIEPVMQGQASLNDATKALEDAVNLLIQQSKSLVG